MPMPQVPLFTRIYVGLAVFSITGSLLGRVAHVDPGPIAPVAAFLTLAAGAVATTRSLWRAPGILLAVLVWGTAVEMLGVATGWPFGRYAYTTEWKPVVTVPGVGNFPLLLPVAWLLMVSACTYSLPERLGRNRALAVLAAGGLAAIIDLAMEPVMAGPLNYWRWESVGPLPGGAPWLNFVGWWLAASAAAVLVLARRATDDLKGDRWNARVVLGTHLILTLALGAITRR